MAALTLSSLIRIVERTERMINNSSTFFQSTLDTELSIAVAGLLVPCLQTQRPQARMGLRATSGLHKVRIISCISWRSRPWARRPRAASGLEPLVMDGPEELCDLKAVGMTL